MFELNAGEWYNREGEPISIWEWAELMDDLKYRRLAETTIGEYWVSTVWIGLDHGLRNGDADPLIFETMVFSKNKSRKDLACWRYASEAAALAGHEKMVEEVKLFAWNP